MKFPKPEKKTKEQRAEERRKKARAKKRAAPLTIRDLIKVADRLHSIFIRAARDGCEMYGYPHAASTCYGKGVHPSELQCAHGWNRGDQSVRFDLRNTYALCPPCHTLYTRNHRQGTARWHDWMVNRIGLDIYRRLQDAAQIWPWKWDRDDLRNIIEERVIWIECNLTGQWREWAMGKLAELAPSLRKVSRG